MAHGQSDQFRRAGWLVAVCGLVAAVGCHGPEKADPVKRLDPSTRQQLMGVGPSKGGTGNAGLDQRFNRTTPTLPDPQLGSTAPPPAPTGGVGAGTPPPGPVPTGLVTAPTRPTNPADFGGPQPAHYSPPPLPPVAPEIQQARGVGPKMPVLIPNESGLPPVEVAAPIAPPPPPPAVPVSRTPPPSSSEMPLPTVPAMPSLNPPPVADPPAPPTPGFRDSGYTPVQSPTEVPPLIVK